MFNAEIINQALDYTREAILHTIAKQIEQKKNEDGAYLELYRLVSDYPFRKGKALRPTLCASTTRAVGGMGHSSLISSAALEMFHNAALVHDDIVDGSFFRRGQDTLHNLVGVPRAINLGDATQVLALSFLLENLKNIGVTKSMYVIHEIENMARQSVEGQAMELDWIANKTFDLTDEDYFRMCTKKTCWYTFIAPCRIGYIIGNEAWVEDNMVDHLSLLTEFGMVLGIAFQIQDDLLNLIGSQEKYGKEIGGDIFEGKRTIMLNHVMHNSKKKKRLKNIIAKSRTDKTEAEVRFVLEEMHKTGSIQYGQELAMKYANKSQALLKEMTFFKPNTPIRAGENWNCEVVDARFIHELVNYVVMRTL